MFEWVQELTKYKDEIGYILIALSFIIGFLGITINLKIISISLAPLLFILGIQAVQKVRWRSRW